MSLWTDDLIEVWLTPETRIVEMLDGSMGPLTYSALTWAYYDALLDYGYQHRSLLEIASYEGWEPAPAPFELRFSSSIALLHQTHEKNIGSLSPAI